MINKLGIWGLCCCYGDCDYGIAQERALALIYLRRNTHGLKEYSQYMEM